jgi:lysyl-tRNA synthetase class II
MKTMKRGLPPSSGMAIGVERLLMALSDLSDPFWD